MTLHAEQQALVAEGPQAEWARAQALRQRGLLLPSERRPADEVLDSWARCFEAGLDAARRVPLVVVEAAELQRRRERADVVRHLACAEMETLSQQIAGSNFLLAFADSDCVILDLVQDNRFVLSNDAGILPGSCWSEALGGTCGLGTARVAGQSVAVTGTDHYFHELGGISCTATPVRDSAGDIVGVLDASSYYASRQQHTQALVQMAATHIENRLMLHEMQTHWVLAVHPRAEFLGTLSAGLMAFDAIGRLGAVNQRARQMLQGLRAAVGSGFEALFAEPFERVWPRLARGGEVRLRDHLGSTVLARCVNLAQRAALTPTLRMAVSRRAAVSLTQAIAPATEGESVVQAAYTLAARAARMGVPVLVQGETGTGKELLARHIHHSSERRGAFVPVNCGALPKELFEAELFGYAGGAFTGARREGSQGLIGSADGGTLLLDEVQELPLNLQAALLRFLDDQRLRAVGSTQSRQVDVQLVAATNADLWAEVAAKRFRSDLLYRLNTVCVTLPPLRERQDLMDCAAELLTQLQPGACLLPDAAPVLLGHAWPGNFRELRAVLARALLSGEGLELGAQALRTAMRSGDISSQTEGRSVLQQLSSERVKQEYARLGNSVSATARALGISRTTVYRYIA